MKKRKADGINLAIQTDNLAKQPRWDSVENQDLNASWGFETSDPKLNFITRTSTTAILEDSINALLLNGIGAGSDEDQRTGRSIRLHQLRIRITASSSLAYIVFDKNANGTAPTLTFAEGNTFFTSNDTGAAWTTTLSSDWLLWPNVHNRGRLIWLETIRQTDNFETYTVDLQGLRTVYNGTGDTIAAISTGALYLVKPFVSNGAGSIVMTYQLSYYDE